MADELSSPDAVGFDLCIVPKPNKDGGSFLSSTMNGSVKDIINICSTEPDTRKHFGPAFGWQLIRNKAHQ